MNETNFKTLMHHGTYVDANMLHSGIYQTSIPFLYSKDTEMYMLEEHSRKFKDMAGTQFISETYFENLKQCELVDIILTFNCEVNIEK